MTSDLIVQFIVSVSVATIVAPLSALAQAGYAEMPNMSNGSAVTSRSDFSIGEVKKIDLGQGKVTLKHGPLNNLGMPAMTMVFRAANPAMLSKLKLGDVVKFKADMVNGAFTVVELLPPV